MNRRETALLRRDLTLTGTAERSIGPFSIALFRLCNRYKKTLFTRATTITLAPTPPDTSTKEPPIFSSGRLGKYHLAKDSQSPLCSLIPATVSVTVRTRPTRRNQNNTPARPKLTYHSITCPIPTLVPSANVIPVNRLTRLPLPARTGLSGQIARGTRAISASRIVSPFA